MSRIAYVEKVPHNGSVIIYGNIGKRVFIGYSIKEARSKYISYCKKWEEEDKKREEQIKFFRETRGMSFSEKVDYITNRNRRIK